MTHTARALVAPLRLQCAQGLLLECLTEPSYLAKGDGADREAHEGLVDVCASLVADGQSTEPVQSGVSALILSLSKDPHPNGDDRVSRCSRCPCARCVRRSPAPRTPGGGIWHRMPRQRATCPDGVAVVRTHRSAQTGMMSTVTAIMTVFAGWPRSCRGRSFDKLTKNGVPRASVTMWRLWPCFPRSVGFGRVAEPLFWPGQTRCRGSPGSSRSHRPRAGAPAAHDGRRPHTPVACQSRNRRQQLIPQPQSISAGSIPQDSPERSTNRMPVSATWFLIGRRPPFGRGRGGGRSGAISSQRSSGRSGLAMPNQR